MSPSRKEQKFYLQASFFCCFVNIRFSWFHKQVNACSESPFSPLNAKNPKNTHITRNCPYHQMDWRGELIILPHVSVRTALSTASETTLRIKYRKVCTCSPWRRSEDFRSSGGNPCFLLSSRQVASKYQPQFNYFALALFQGT